MASVSVHQIIGLATSGLIHILLLKPWHYSPPPYWPSVPLQPTLNIRIAPHPPDLVEFHRPAEPIIPAKTVPIAQQPVVPSPPISAQRRAPAFSLDKKTTRATSTIRSADLNPTPPPLPTTTEAITTQTLLDQIAHMPQRSPQLPWGKKIAVYGPHTMNKVWEQYVEDWVRKIERLGTLNYPEAAKHQRLSGGPVLRIRLNADGSLQNITIVRHSQSRILDEAAITSVKMSTPFAPFPPALKKHYQALDIVRKWTFTTQNQLSGR